MSRLRSIVDGGERDNIEFKEYLNREVHLSEDRRQGLACQMNHRMLIGGGRAIYVLGVTDDGRLRGISREALDESLFVIRRIAAEVEAEVKDVEEYQVNGGHVALVSIQSSSKVKEHILIGTAGHVDHGKSTLVGTLVTGKYDDGAGRTRMFFDVQPHEIERGLSADLSYGCYGFSDGEPQRLNNPLNKREKAGIVERVDKLVSFVDTVGHEPWLRTTIRGIVGQKLDYGLLVVAADDGVTHVTKEHLGVLLAMDLPTIIAITKIDRVTPERIQEVEDSVQQLLKQVGRIPLRLNGQGVNLNLLEKESNGLVCPIVRVSPVTGEGIDLLDELLLRLPKRKNELSKPFQLYVDKVYHVTGVGLVVSGTVRQGEVHAGDTVYVGPDNDGEFTRAKVQSIEMHYYRVDRAAAGDIVGVALKGKDLDVERGMVLCTENHQAVWEFDAEVMVLNHPTRVKEGYEPVMHLETISEATVFTGLDTEYLMAGQTGKARLRFKFKPYMVEEGQKFIFREGRSKGIGKVTSVD